MDSEYQVIIFLANQDFKDEEYSGVKEELDSASIGGKIVAPEPGECIGMNGTELTVDMTSDNVNIEDFSGIVYIGGPGIERILNHTGAQTLAKAFFTAGKIVAAICWAPAILARAGVLNGKRATVWDGAKNDLIKGGAQYSGEVLTSDGNIITANGPDAAVIFGQAVAGAVIRDSQ